MRSGVAAALAGFLVGAVFAASEAEAGCCRLVKVDSEIPAYKVRACEPRASKRNQPAHARAKAVDERCGKNLFTGKLALGEAQLVCTDGESILYAFERPRGGGFGPLIEASCDGTDVQF